MARHIDLTNQKFERLTVISRLPNGNKGRTRWLCKCDCGNTKEVLGQNLRNGHVRSCGCLHAERTIRDNHKHGFHGTRLYRIYIDMFTRCHKPSSKNYPQYGGKGITVCKEWYRNPKAFCEWALKNGYKDHLTIDRIDGSKGYSPDNCRWADYSVQNFNKKRNSRNTSGYTGVSFNKNDGVYVAYIMRNKKHTHLGSFDTVEAAYEARKKAEQSLYKDLL